MHESYLWFSIAARVPIACVAASASSLLVLSVMLAFEAWKPVAIVVTIVGLFFMTVLYWVDGVRHIAHRLMESLRANIELYFSSYFYFF